MLQYLWNTACFNHNLAYAFTLLSLLTFLSPPPVFCSLKFVLVYDLAMFECGSFTSTEQSSPVCLSAFQSSPKLIIKEKLRQFSQFSTLYYLWSHNHAIQFYFIKLNELQVYIIFTLAAGFVQLNITYIMVILVVGLEIKLFFLCNMLDSGVRKYMGLYVHLLWHTVW